MNTKILSVLLMATITGVPAAFGASADMYGTADGRHFRSPPQVGPSTAAPAAAPAAEAPKPAKAAKAAPADDSLFPPNGKPGECYTRVLVMAPTSIVSERVRVQEESYRLIEIPAVLEEVDQKVLVRAASQRQEVIPATYKEVEEQVLVAPAYTKKNPRARALRNRHRSRLGETRTQLLEKGHRPARQVGQHHRRDHVLRHRAGRL